MSDWDDVSCLAAEFKKLQESVGAQRLSERNCVEVVAKLVENGMLEILYTLDGKEYLTPQHLEREIKDELLTNKGRLNIVYLQQLLNIDLFHIEARVSDMLKRDRNVVLLHGELIDKSYITTLCEEVNETLQEVGLVSITDLSKSFNLPIDFLMEHLQAAISENVIVGNLDKYGSGAIYTKAFMARYMSRIRGLFCAVTRPTAVSPLISQGSFQSNLFLSILHNLVSQDILPGSLHGHLEKSVYIPDIYTKLQNKWADSFISSNGFLEYDALKRLGIDNPSNYISQRYSSSNIIQLTSCAVGDGVMTELGARLDESLSSDGWVDVLSLLPAPCTEEDGVILLQKLYSTDSDLKLCGSFVFKKSLLQSCFDQFVPNIKEKAQKVVVNDAVKVSEMFHQLDQLDDSNIHTKKSSRNKRKEKKKETSKDVTPRSQMIEFMSTSEISASLTDNLADCPECIISEVVSEISGPLQAMFMDEVRSCMSSRLESKQGPSEHKRKNANVQEQIQGLWTNARLFSLSTSLFDDNAATQLSKYLLRTICTSLANIITLYISGSSDELKPEDLDSKERIKIYSSLGEVPKKMLTDLDRSLSAKNTETFFRVFENICMESFCGIMLKKADKKKERQLLFSHQQSLLSSLKAEHEAAMCLHLITVILFQQKTGCIIHIPGKLVPVVIAFLSKDLDAAVYGRLLESQRLVSEQLRSAVEAGSGDATDIEDPVLDLLLTELKEMVLNKPEKATPSK